MDDASITFEDKIEEMKINNKIIKDRNNKLYRELCNRIRLKKKWRFVT